MLYLSWLISLKLSTGNLILNQKYPILASVAYPVLLSTWSILTFFMVLHGVIYSATAIFSGNAESFIICWLLHIGRCFSSLWYGVLHLVLFLKRLRTQSSYSFQYSLQGCCFLFRFVQCRPLANKVSFCIVHVLIEKAMSTVWCTRITWTVSENVRMS